MTAAKSLKVDPARILIVEDHPFFRQGLVAWIDRQPDLVCCGEADSAVSARKAVADLDPDLVILDLGLRGDDGLELIKELRSEYPDLRILVISQRDETVFAERALRAGARGYVMKEEATEQVLDAIHYVLRGEIHLSRRMTTHLLQRSLEEGQRPAAVEGLEALSDRELQVFELIGTGLTNLEIAARLGISAKTVETHRENIKTKLRLPNAPALKAAAMKWLSA